MKQQERGVLSMVREALAAEKPDAQRVPALLMELKTAAATADQEAKSQSAAEQLARKRVAEADDELRALKYQRAQIVRQLAKSQGGGNARDVDAQTISAQDAQRVRAHTGGLDDKHSMTIFRLGVERDERARLCAERDALVSQRETLAAAAKTASELKAAVDLQLETVCDVAKKLGSALPKLQPAASAAQNGGLPGELLELLPSPMYTLAIGLAANVVALHADASIDIVGDAAAARSLAAAGAATSAAAEGSLAQDGAPAEVSIVAHPLSLKLSLCAGAATLTFQWMPTLEVLTASAEPRSLEATLRSLDEMQLESDGSGAEGAEGAGGSAAGGFPDLPSLLRARGGCKRQPLVVEALQPYWPYKWLQWLGGLGPLLTARPQSAQPVLEALVQSVVAASSHSSSASSAPPRKKSR